MMNLLIEVFTSLLVKLYLFTTSLILFYGLRIVVLFFIITYLWLNFSLVYKLLLKFQFALGKQFITSLACIIAINVKWNIRNVLLLLITYAQV